MSANNTLFVTQVDKQTWEVYDRSIEGEGRGIFVGKAFNWEGAFHLCNNYMEDGNIVEYGITVDTKSFLTPAKL